MLEREAQLPQLGLHFPLLLLLLLSSSTSWSDCLEMARKSDRNGEHAVAKYWLETALGRLPDANNATGTASSEQKHGKVQILVASLNMDYRAGAVLYDKVKLYLFSRDFPIQETFGVP